MPDFKPFAPTPERPCTLSAVEAATPGHPVWAEWQARIDAGHATRHGPPTPAEAHNARQSAVLERVLLGRVRTRGLG